MNADVPIRWVLEHSGDITGGVPRLKNRAPYEVVDYLQDAFIAAMKAYRVVPDTGSELFKQVFWRLYRNAVIEKTCISIPRYRCTTEEITLHALEDQHSSEPSIDRSRLLFLWILPHLTQKQRAALNWWLGQGKEGALSEREAAKAMNVSRARFRELVDESITKTINLVSEDQQTKSLLKNLFAMLESMHQPTEKGD